MVQLKVSQSHSLENKVVVVTGGASGIGEAICRQAVQAGGRVVITDINESGKALAAELGEKARFFALDVTDEAAWTAALKFATKEFGQVNGLVNNAGAAPNAKPLVDETLAEFKRLVDVNLTSVFLGTKAVVPLMRGLGGGSIVNVSSTAGLIGLQGTHGYGAAKWGVRGMSKLVAVEEGQHGIRVNSIHPGFIATPMTTDLFKASGGKFPTVYLQQRSGQPDEIAGAAVFLLSDAASYVTGAELVIDGGWTAGR